jgi:hypothetical protein
MNLFSQARRIARRYRNNPELKAKLEAEHLALTELILTNPESAALVTSSTIAGQTQSSTYSMTNQQRLDYLGFILDHMDAGRSISSVSISYF